MYDRWLRGKKTLSQIQDHLCQNDDYLALQEVLTRRFKLNEQNPDLDQLPDLFILDGGKGQLGILSDLAQKYPHFKNFDLKCNLQRLEREKRDQRPILGKKAKNLILLCERHFMYGIFEKFTNIL